MKDFIPKNKGILPLEFKISILKDVASGVSHLHSQNIIHGDLSDGNVLLTPALQAKIADFGVSRVFQSMNVHNAASSMTSAPGTLGFMPPEAHAPNPVYGTKLDCFSFGHLTLFLLNEIVSCIKSYRYYTIVITAYLNSLHVVYSV